jgi:hypothetical protein
VSLANFFIRQNDKQPYIRATLTDATGAAIDVTTGTVTFTMVNDATGVVKINAAAAIKITPASGIVEYRWTGTDTDTAGLFLARWRYTNGASEVMTIPNTGDLLIQIGD